MNISIENRKPPRMRSVPQAEEQLKADGIHEIRAPRLRLWAKQGVIPSVQCGKKILINYDALLDFLSNGVIS